MGKKMSKLNRELFVTKLITANLDGLNKAQKIRVLQRQIEAVQEGADDDPFDLPDEPVSAADRTLPIPGVL